MSGKKLLVADDSLTIQKVIRLALSHEGYEIQAVSDGSEAVEQLLLFRPQIVLIDVSLPGKSATEVKALADEKPELSDVRFVLMSSAFEQVDEKKIEKAGFAGRLTKPFDPAHLRKVLTESLQHRKSEPELPSFDPPAFEVTEKSPESDIRQLTESTLKMTGIGDFDWTVNEAPKKTPEMETFDLSPSLPPLPQMNVDTPAFPPLSIPTVHREAPAPNPEIRMDESLQKQIQQQVEAAIAKLSREAISEIAERLIKEEIHRLLKEGP